MDEPHRQHVAPQNPARMQPNYARYMSSIHFIGGEKGGVGKSLFARVLAQYLIDHELPLAAFDSDQSHGSLLRCYADYTQPIVPAKTDGLDRAVEAAAEDGQLSVLIDLAAQTHGSLQAWLQSADVPGLAAELQIGLTYWHVMDAGHDSVSLLSRLIDELDPRVRLVLVLNEIRGDQFEQLQSSGVKARAEERGALALAMPRLPDNTVQRIDSHGASFWAAINPQDPNGSALGLIERQRVKVWLQRLYAEIARVGVVG